MKMEQAGTRFQWLVIGPFLVVVALLVALGIASAQVLSAVRAYVGGEGLWSKGQKDAVYYLSRYIRTGAEADYGNYLQSVALPLGDRDARREMEQPTFSDSKVIAGFVKGGVAAEDVPEMIFLFRHFQHL